MLASDRGTGPARASSSAAEPAAVPDALQRFAQLTIKDTETGKVYMLAESAVSPTGGGLSQTLVELETNNRQTFQYDLVSTSGADDSAALQAADAALAGLQESASAGRLQQAHPLSKVAKKGWCVLAQRSQHVHHVAQLSLCLLCLALSEPNTCGVQAFQCSATGQIITTHCFWRPS